MWGRIVAVSCPARVGQSVSEPLGSGSVLVPDRLVISMNNGSSPQPLTLTHLTGSGGLGGFVLKDESSN